MVDLCGARLVPGTVDVYPEPAAPRVVSLRIERMERLLGERIPPERVQEILVRLGFEAVEEGWRVPYWRDADVQREADLIEEVARVHGLDKLPTTLPARDSAVGRLTQSQRLRRRTEDLLRDRGLHECIAYSFTSREALRQLRLGADPVLELSNPLSADQSVMRPLLLPGLLDVARHNTAHGQAGLALFESAHVYRPAPAVPWNGAPPGQETSPGGALPAEERHHLAVLLTEAAPGGWRTPRRAADFFTARALLEPLLEVAGLRWEAREGGPPFLHPGRAASIHAGGRELGWLGELHPLVVAGWDLADPVSAFELDFDALLELAGGGQDVYRDVTSFPAVLQDIAVVVDEDVSAQRVEEAVRRGGGELLGRISMFDLYRGEQVGEGNKSLALRLEFRAPDRTLTDEDVAERRAAIERELASLGGRLRA
jgi:phenylalanyl-tRNA synthetase beta chain